MSFSFAVWQVQAFCVLVTSKEWLDTRRQPNHNVFSAHFNVCACVHSCVHLCAEFVRWLLTLWPRSIFPCHEHAFIVAMHFFRVCACVCACVYLCVVLVRWLLSLLRRFVSLCNKHVFIAASVAIDTCTLIERHVLAFIGSLLFPYVVCCFSSGLIHVGHDRCQIFMRANILLPVVQTHV